MSKTGHFIYLKLVFIYFYSSKIITHYEVREYFNSKDIEFKINFAQKFQYGVAMI